MTIYDERAERKGTASIKWDFQSGAFGREGLLPFWIADTDYPTCPAIVEALEKRVATAAFGYAAEDDGYYDSVRGWFLRRHGWEVSREWIVTTTGVVSAIDCAVRALTEPGDGIIVQTPVYDPFYRVIESAGRKILRNKLILERGSYLMDFDDLEKKLSSGARMLILCSPHNPVGRVWSGGELARVAELCENYGVYLLSDEIHWDIMIGKSRHMTMGRAAKNCEKLIVCTAPSKTFNLAGLKTSNIVVPGEETRSRLRGWLESHQVEGPNALGLVACRAAYESGAEWADGQNAYLTENYAFAQEFFASELAGVSAAPLEGTYLLWLDMRPYELSSDELKRRISEKGAALNGGARYGEDYDGFMRMNIACPRSQLQEGLEMMRAALEG